MDLLKFNHEILKKAEVLIRVKRELEYLGIISYGLNIYVVSMENIKKTSGGRTTLGYTDGKNIVLAANPDVTPNELAFVICHEIIHVIGLHIGRTGGRDPLIWNMCIDHCVNRALMEYAQRDLLKVPPNLVFFEDIHKKNPAISPEELYAIMERDAAKWNVEIFEFDGNGQPQKISGGSGSGSSDGDESDQKDESGGGSGSQSKKSKKSKKGGGSGDGESKPGDGNNSLKGKRFAKISNPKTGESYIVPLDGESDELEVKKNCKSIAESARMLWNSQTINKGNMPGSIVQELESMFKLELPWDEILRRSVLYHSQKLEHKSWRERDFYTKCQILPGRAVGEDTQIAIFMIDSSGSVSDTDLKKFLGIVCGATYHYDKIVVIVHDYIVHMEEWFLDKPSEEEVFERIRKIKGRGGTSHKDAFDLVAKINEENLISMVVISTDYCSDIEQIHRDYSWLKDLPMVFVLNSNAKVDLEDYDIKVIRVLGGNEDD